MARVNKNNLFSGKFGNLIFRDIKGKPFVKPKAEKVNQSKATKISSSEFIQCSQWAKSIRLSLIPFLVGLTDYNMYRRLTGQLYKAILENTHIPKGERTPINADMSGLTGFEFNINSPFSEYFLPKIEVSLNSQRQVVVNISEFEPKSEVVFAEKTYQAELLIHILASSLEPNTAAIETYFIVPIERQTNLIAAIDWTSLAFPTDYFVLVSAKLMYFTSNKFTEKNYVNSKELSPACVLMAAHT
jgi:hypothetical protein